MQGTGGDFLMGAFGPSGVYYRNDLFYYDANAGVRPLGGALAGLSHSQVLADLSKFIWLTDTGDTRRPLWSLGLVANGACARLWRRCQRWWFGSLQGRRPQWGLGDITVSPMMLNWTVGSSHITFAPSVTAPTGQYDPDYLLNISRHYWSLYLGGAYTPGLTRKLATRFPLPPACCSIPRTPRRIIKLVPPSTLTGWWGSIFQRVLPSA